MKPKTVVVALIAGAVGAGLTLAGQGFELSVAPVGMTFTEFAGILLAAVAILITALGVVIAIAAIWGFSGIKTGAEVAAVQHVAAQLTPGGALDKKLDVAFFAFMETRLKDVRFRQLVEDRVNEMLFGGESAPSYDEDEHELDEVEDEIAQEAAGAAVTPDDQK